MMDTSHPAPKAGRREWIGLAVIALPCLVYAMDMTVLNLALPALSTALQPSSSQLLWIVDIYGFLVAGFLITMGTLGDRIGRRKLLLIGAAAFAAASTVAAFSDSAEMLIAMRALLGVAGATLAPSTMSLIRNMFHDEQQRQFAIGVWIAAFSLGAAIGPLVGGVLLQFFWWGSVFLVAVPVMLLLLLVGPSLLPEYRDPHAGRVDAASVALSLASVLVTIYGLKQIAEHGLAWLPVLLVLAGVVVGWLFVRRQGRLAYPLLDLTLFRRATFSAAIAAYALSCLAMFGVYIFVTQYLQLVLGLSPLAAGLATVPSALAFVAGSLFAPRIAQRVTGASLLVWGLAGAAVGFGLITLAGTGAGLALVVVGMVVMSLGMAPVFTIGNEMIITAAPPERAGAASAISETSSEFSGALGIAVFGSLGTVFYRTGLASAMPPGVPAEAAATAMTTLGGAVAAAESVPGSVGQALLGASRAAFVDALQFNAAAGALIVVAASVVAAAILRKGATADVAAAKAS
ncbi:MFS transporter [Schlegelella sp. S2-27]|uniref:MFS transporter n=1 Tax=Caldimonas mangrovi TaxID=2944811 RepID=A0ABT0YL23_9BURK|nr:MFS transporter [Caldimonas mangrovi]MCM5678917.1 MFS transporter [Caldimonas mangrovi]